MPAFIWAPGLRTWLLFWLPRSAQLIVVGKMSRLTPFYPHREEIEKQKAKERYMKMHLAGKTEQAKADLARLAIIRKQREEAARKKEEERKGKSGARVAACPVPGQPPNPALHCPRCVTGWGCVVE